MIGILIGLAAALFVLLGVQLALSTLFDGAENFLLVLIGIGVLIWFLNTDTWINWFFG